MNDKLYRVVYSKGELDGVEEVYSTRGQAETVKNACIEIVAKYDIAKGDWRSMSEKEQEELLEQVSRDFSVVEYSKGNEVYIVDTENSWQGLYVNGELKRQSLKIGMRELTMFCPINKLVFATISPLSDYDEEECDLPIKIEDIYEDLLIETLV